ncbi:MEMO1 family protein [Geoglobus acetivorans]|uniref:MEMO1 family protein LPQ35_04605 n=1 Tax=Geoglobus acetivorans TaxID=565033 RepID=A0ABZ3H7G1_GEOAI|nr:MEMO1 family protein [Geoglobus acetivorans]
MRYPRFAGSFYPSNPESLLAMLSDFTDRGRKDDDVVAIVSPHAGYMYSGRTAGRVHSLLRDAETYIIIGPNHTGLGMPVAVSSDEWGTPIGVSKPDSEFVDAMPKATVVPDEMAFAEEHSLEVQLPFLQFLHSDFEIVPICMGLQDEESAREVAREIIQAYEETGKKIAVVASSDMHHYIPDEECRRRDEIIIEAVESMDVRSFYRTIYDTQASVCGYGPIAVAMLVADYFDASAELVHYSTSGDVADKSFVVGYAGIVFRI